VCSSPCTHACRTHLADSALAYVDQRYLPLRLFFLTPADPISLVGTGHVDKAAIFNSEGNSVWATSACFQLSPAEMAEVVGAFKDTSAPKKVLMNGLHIAGQKYFVLKADDGSIYGKQVRTSSCCMRIEAEKHG
jgi:hypothetical protein